MHGANVKLLARNLAPVKEETSHDTVAVEKGKKISLPFVQPR
jgi:hypothetical protein